MRWKSLWCIHTFLMNQLLKEFLKSVHICQSYYQTSMGILLETWSTCVAFILLVWCQKWHTSCKNIFYFSVLTLYCRDVLQSSLTCIENRLNENWKYFWPLRAFWLNRQQWLSQTCWNDGTWQTCFIEEKLSYIQMVEHVMEHWPWCVTILFFKYLF